MYDENKKKDKDYASKIMSIMADEFNVYQDSLHDRHAQMNPNLASLTMSIMSTPTPDLLLEF